MHTYLISTLTALGTIFTLLSSSQISTPPLQQPVVESELGQSEPQAVRAVSILEPQEPTAAPTPPLIDYAAFRSLETKLDALATKVDNLASRPQPVQSAFPTADEIAMRVSERVATKVADAVVDKVADRVVEKIKSLLIGLKAADGTARTIPIPVAPSGSQAFKLAPGEVVTHIDGVPVQQPSATATALSQSGWIPSSPVYETPAFQVMQSSPNQVRILPRYREAPTARCRVVNGRVVCN